MTMYNNESEQDLQEGSDKSKETGQATKDSIEQGGQNAYDAYKRYQSHKQSGKNPSSEGMDSSNSGSVSTNGSHSSTEVAPSSSPTQHSNVSTEVNPSQFTSNNGITGAGVQGTEAGTAGTAGAEAGTATATGTATTSGTAAAGGAAASGATISGGWIVLIIVIFILIIILIMYMFMPSGWMRGEDVDTDDALVTETSYNREYENTVKKTKEAITDAYDFSMDKAQETLDDYIEENYPDDNDHITLTIIHEELSEVADTITPYIQAINGSIQASDDTGDLMGLGEELSVVTENEYNSIGSAYVQAIQDEILWAKDSDGNYTANSLFHVSTVYEDVEDVEYEEPKYDENGLPVMKNLVDENNQVIRDENGEILQEQVYETVTHPTGTIYVSVFYDFSNYKDDDVLERATYLANVDTNYTESEWIDSLYEQASWIMYEITGSTELTASGGIPLAYIEDVGEWGFNGSISAGSYGSAGGETFQDYGENIELGRNDPLWYTIIAAGNAGNFTLYKGGSQRQCTDFAHWIFWTVYGKDCGNGNGSEMAATTVEKYKDEFTLSTSPAPGSIGSYYSTGNHVFFVTKVEGAYMWICEGNFYNKGVIRMNYKVNIAQYTREHQGNLIYAVPTN